MGEEKENIQDLAQKVDELLNVLKVISGDLSEVSRSLKLVCGSTTGSTKVVAASERKHDIKDVKQKFSPELAGMLLFEENKEFVIVKPKRFLGSENFSQIASIVDDIGGKYVSAGRNSHFKIEKK